MTFSWVIRTKNLIKSILSSTPAQDISLNIVGEKRDGKDVVDIIFVHGLGGSAIETWHHDSNVDSSWPVWLGEDIKWIQIWTTQWPAKNYLGLTHQTKCPFKIGL